MSGVLDSISLRNSQPIPFWMCTMGTSTRSTTFGITAAVPSILWWGTYMERQSEYSTVLSALLLTANIIVVALVWPLGSQVFRLLKSTWMKSMANRIISASSQRARYVICFYQIYVIDWTAFSQRYGLIPTRFARSVISQYFLIAYVIWYWCNAVPLDNGPH